MKKNWNAAINFFTGHFNFRHYSSKINLKKQNWSLTCQIIPQIKETLKGAVSLKLRLDLPLRKAANMCLNLQTLPCTATLRTYCDIFLAYDLEEEVAFFLYFTYSNSFILNVTVSKRENWYGVTLT